MQQKKTFLVLAVLLIGLAAFSYFYEYKGAPERERLEDESKQLFKVKQDDVTQIVIENKNGRFVIKHEGEEWTLIEPVKAKADANAAKDVVYALDTLRFSKKLEGNPNDLSPYGLSTPAIRVQLTTKSGEMGLKVGEKAPFGSDRYIQKEGDESVYLTSSYLGGKLDQDLLGFRDKRIIDLSIPEVRTIRISGANVPGLEARREGKDWFSADDPPLKLDRTRVEGILYGLEGLRTQQFTGQTDPSLYNLDPPALTVELEIGDDKTKKTLYFGPPTGDQKRLPVVRAKGEEIRLVDGSILDKLGKSAKDLRDTQVVRFSKSALDKIVATVEDHAITARRKDDTWKIEGGSGDALAPSDIDAIVEDLRQLKATDFFDDVPSDTLARYGLDSPSVHIELFESKDSSPLKIDLGQPTSASEGPAYARVNEGTTVYQLSRYILEDIHDVLVKPKAHDATPTPGG